jgi:hypothetical protein
MRTLLAVISVLSVGCASMNTAPNDPGVICTAIAVSSLNVTVHDAATGARVCDATVVAIHQSGERNDLMPFPSDPQACNYAGPWERAGEFEVRVSRPGYQDARVAGVRVTADECHVIPVAVPIDLRPE